MSNGQQYIIVAKPIARMISVEIAAERARRASAGMNWRRIKKNMNKARAFAHKDWNNSHQGPRKFVEVEGSGA